jgi:hypothetical protein
MKRRGAAIAVAAIAMAAVPAGATTVTAIKGKEVRYRVTVARGFEFVQWAGTPFANCAGSQCGTAGTVSYKFSGTPRKSRAFLIVDRKGRVIGGRASFATHGTTKSFERSPSGTSCSNTVAHHSDYFQFTGVSSKRVLYELRNGTGSPDYLHTRCPGPTEVNLIDSDAVPSATFSATGLNHASDNFSLKGSRNFVDAGYQGTVSWHLRYSIVRVR